MTDTSKPHAALDRHIEALRIAAIEDQYERVKAIEALAAERDALVTPQPIETAPDGLHFRGLEVVNNKTGKSHWEWFAGVVDDVTGEFVTQSGDDTGWSAEDFTHWFPIPTVQP